MSKHQTCAECRRSFVGPDTGIGDNLCDSCAQELHAECRQALAELQEENDRLQAIVAKLPKTADGVPVVPGMEVWQDCFDGIKQRWAASGIEDDRAMVTSFVYAECYSTRKAAEDELRRAREAAETKAAHEAAEAAKGAE